MVVKCDVCNYVASSQGDLNKHLKTKKHTEKVKQSIPKPNQVNLNQNWFKSVQKNDKNNIGINLITNYSNHIANQCTYCMVIFSTKSSLLRHYDRCKVKKQKEQDEKIQQQLEIERLKCQLELQKKDTEMLKKQYETIHDSDEFHKKVIACNTKNIDNLIETNMRALTFLNTFYRDGPCLKYFTDEFKDQYTFYKDSKNPKFLYDGENFIVNGKVTQKDDYITQLAIDLYNLDTVVKYYVNKIIEYYKNDKFPELQAMWVGDTERLGYNIRVETVGSNKKSWYQDKGGIQVVEMIIDPMFNFTCNILNKSLIKLKEELAEVTKEKELDLMMPLVRRMASISGFIDLVEKREIQPKIIKAMTNHFSLDTNKHKLLLENKIENIQVIKNTK
jgi:hypothetical protein